MSAIFFGGGQSTLLITRKTWWQPLQFFCFCPRSPPAIFASSNLRHRSRQREHKQPHSRINTAISCVFTFHSAISVCHSCPKLFCSISHREEGLVPGPTVQMSGPDSEHHYSTKSLLSCPLLLSVVLL